MIYLASSSKHSDFNHHLFIKADLTIYIISQDKKYNTSVSYYKTHLYSRGDKYINRVCNLPKNVKLRYVDTLSSEQIKNILIEKIIYEICSDL